VKDLAPLFDPRSVAIVGASDDPAKWGYAVALQALRAADRRPIHLVNRRGGTILGRPAVSSLTAIGEPVDLVVVSVPASSFESTVDEALSLGARAIVGITAGFAELGDDGLARQQAIVERVVAAGAVLVGPNCLGVVDNTTDLYLSSDQFSQGSVALVSQSGNLALEFELRFARHGLGFSRFISMGNQADVTLVDLVEDCARHDGTRAIAVYAEDFMEGRGFAVAAAAALTEHGKPVVLLTTGAGEASARGAASHTGALTSSSDVIEAACRDAGIHLAHTPRELTSLLVALIAKRRSTGRRTAVLTDGGGHGSIAADVAERAGLTVPELSLTTQAAVRAVLWDQSAVGNPVDLAGMGEQDPMSYALSLGALLAADDVDAVLMTGYFGGYSESSAGMAGGSLAEGEAKAGAEIARLVVAAGKPVAMQSMYPHSQSCRPMSDAGVPVFGATEDAARSLAAITGVLPPRGFTPLPPAAQPRTATQPSGAARLTSTTTQQPSATSPFTSAEPVGGVGYFSVRRLLSQAGVPFPAARGVTSVDELRAAAAEIPGPYVLKALHLLHKSDVGGVLVGLCDIDALVDAHARMHARLGARSYSVEAMVDLTDGVELIVGVNTDARFGPVAMIGLGGVYTEVLRDVTFALSPVPADLAVDLLRSLRSAALLTGVRGRPAVDLDAAAQVVARITACAAAHPEIAEIEVNPLLVTPRGAIALDARAILTPPR
jgi:acyl-CoA synthetase (NDP forming)